MLLHAPDVLIADSGRDVDDDVEDNDDDGDDLYIIGAVRLSAACAAFIRSSLCCHPLSLLFKI